MRLLAGRRRGLEGCKNLLRCGRMQLSTRLERFMNLADHLDHRPYPLPDAPWVMHQAWCDFLFLHWRVDAAVLRQIVPEPLELHLHEGDAWVGVIPFHMTDVRPRGTVNVPGISAFPELNVRTYVKVGDRVASGQLLAIVEGEKQLESLSVRAPSVVVEIGVEDGAEVPAGTTLIKVIELED